MILRMSRAWFDNGTFAYLTTASDSPHRLRSPEDVRKAGTRPHPLSPARVHRLTSYSYSYIRIRIRSFVWHLLWSSSVSVSMRMSRASVCVCAMSCDAEKVAVNVCLLPVAGPWRHREAPGSDSAVGLRIYPDRGGTRARIEVHRGRPPSLMMGTSNVEGPVGSEKEEKERGKDVVVDDKGGEEIMRPFLRHTRKDIPCASWEPTAM